MKLFVMFDAAISPDDLYEVPNRNVLGVFSTKELAVEYAYKQLEDIYEHEGVHLFKDGNKFWHLAEEEDEAPLYTIEAFTLDVGL